MGRAERGRAGALLIACRAAPGTGGGSTCAYALFRALQEDGVAVRFLAVIARRDEPYYAHVGGADFANPERLPDVGCCLLDDAGAARHPELEATLEAIAPGVILAVGDETALLMGRDGGVPVVLYVTGADEPEEDPPPAPDAGLAAALRAARARRSRGPHPFWVAEAVQTAYLVVAPSEPAREVYAASFPSYAGRIHPRAVWAAEWVARDVERWSALRRPWGERDVDVILVANRWSRPLKNLGLARKIRARLRDRSVVVVGEGQGESPGARSLGLVPRRAEYLGLLGRAKVLVCPSTFEAASTPLYEAAVMGCNVVASPDCGNVELCDPDLVCAPGDAASFVETVRLAVAAPRGNRLADLTAAGSYADLIETLEVVA